MNLLKITKTVLASVREKENRATDLEAMLALADSPKTTLELQKATKINYGSIANIIRHLRKHNLIHIHSKSEEKTGNNQSMSRYSLSKEGELAVSQLLNDVKTNFNQL